MYVKTLIAGFIVAIIAIIYVFSRGDFNRSRVSNDKGSLDKLGEGSAAARESIDRIKSDFDKLSVNTESAIKRTEDIKQNNNSAREGINNALGILEQAKNRDNT